MGTEQPSRLGIAIDRVEKARDKCQKAWAAAKEKMKGIELERQEAEKELRLAAIEAMDERDRKRALIARAADV